MLPGQLTDAVAQLSGSDAGLLAGYAALLWLPGIAIGALAGLRGWSLVALGPLLTYGLATVTGPWLPGWGLAWRPGTAGLVLLGALALLALLRWPLGRMAAASPGRWRPAPLPAWTAAGQLGVAVTAGAAGLFGGAVLLGAFGGLGAIPQDWDALLHANGTRYLAETGDSGVYGMYTVNTFATGGQVYYPNAYHLVAALAFELTGADIPAVLNAQSVLLPLMLALVLVALVRSFRGRAALAVFAALVSPMATAMPYDLLWRGPLLPFATGVVLVLGGLVALRGYLDRPSVLAAVPLVLAGAGLLGLHSSMLFTLVLFALPLLGQRWWGLPRRIGIEAGLLLVPVAVGGLLVVPHLLGALSAAPGVLAFSWPQTMTPGRALGQVFGFGTLHTSPQVALLVLLAAGTLGIRFLGQLRWLAAAAVVFAALFVLSAAYHEPWAQQLTSLWWNDKYRLAAIATLALLPVAANGLLVGYDALHRGLLLPARRPLRGAVRRPARRDPRWAAPVLAAAVAVAFFLLAEHGYAQRNIERTAQNYGPRFPVVSPAERTAFGVLATVVAPGERVLNDRYDGSGWMYALAGVHPVAGHYGLGSVGADPELLATAFNQYDVNPQVRAAAARLGVRWVIVGPSFVRADIRRQSGLVHLDRVTALHLVYDRDGVQIYQLARPARSVSPEPAAAPDASLADG